MSAFETQVGQNSAQGTRAEGEYQQRRMKDDAHYISTPQAANSRTDWADYSGLSPDSQAKPLACKWWAQKHEKQELNARHADETPIVSKDPARSLPRRLDRPAESHLAVSGRPMTATHGTQRSHKDCDWSNSAERVGSAIMDLRAYLSVKLRSINPTSDVIEKYTHMITYQFAELSANLRPHLIILEKHDENCVWIPSCSWRCGLSYMQMGSVLSGLIETQMLSNACIMKLHNSLKTKKAQLTQQGELLREMEEQVQQMRDQLEALSETAIKEAVGPPAIASLETMVESDDTRASERVEFWSEAAQSENGSETGRLIQSSGPLTPVCSAAIYQDCFCRLKRMMSHFILTAKSAQKIEIMIAFIGGMIIGGLIFGDVIAVILEKFIESVEPPQLKYLCERKIY